MAPLQVSALRPTQGPGPLKFATVSYTQLLAYLNRHQHTRLFTPVQLLYGEQSHTNNRQLQPGVGFIFGSTGCPAGPTKACSTVRQPQSQPADVHMPSVTGHSLITCSAKSTTVRARSNEFSNPSRRRPRRVPNVANIHPSGARWFR